MSSVHMSVDGCKVRPPAFLSSSSLGCFFSASPMCHDFDPKGSPTEDKMMILYFYFPKFTNFIKDPTSRILLQQI